jgi:hypothetical protein
VHGGGREREWERLRAEATVVMAAALGGGGGRWLRRRRRRRRYHTYQHCLTRRGLLWCLHANGRQLPALLRACYR